MPNMILQVEHEAPADGGERATGAWADWAAQFRQAFSLPSRKDRALVEFQEACENIAIYGEQVPEDGTGSRGNAFCLLVFGLEFDRN